MVEASMIFPLVIAGVIAVIYIIMGLYNSMALQTALHLSLRDQCGQLSDTIYREESFKPYEVSQDFYQLRPILAIEETQEHKTSKIFTQRIQRTEKGRSYVIDEAEFVRKCYLVKEVL